MFETVAATPFEGGDPETVHRSEAAALNRRIVLMSGVVLAELWALTAALDAWAEGRSAVLGWILAFQAVSFLLALSITMASTAPAYRRAPAPMGAPQPATD
ncbi:MAG TPA: hypothetical protein VHL54_07605 [Actinomycetota bacterium]|nr:hypothetical protein [Actinomycetota bacterium]